jgi:hypothetical protein
MLTVIEYDPTNLHDFLDAQPTPLFVFMANSAQGFHHIYRECATKRPIDRHELANWTLSILFYV